MTFNNHWDLVILDPVLLVLGLTLFFGLYGHKYRKLKDALFILQIFLLWFSLGVCLQNGFNVQHSIYFLRNQFVNASLTSIILIAGLFATIFIIPLQWITNVFKNRQHFIASSCWLAAIAVFVEIFVPILAVHIISTILLGLVTAAGTLYFLAFSDRYEQRFNPMRTVVVVSPLILISIFTGLWINLLLRNGGTTEPTGDSALVIKILTIIGLLGSGALAFIPNEAKGLVGNFDINRAMLFEPVKLKTIIFLFICVFLLIANKTLLDNDLWSLWGGQIGYDHKETQGIILLNMRTQKTLFLALQIVGGLSGGVLFVRRLGVKISINIMLFFFFAATLFATFNHTTSGFLVVSVVTGYCYGLLFNIFFSFVLMWNARTQNKILVGGFLSLIYGVQYIINTVVTGVNINQKGIFHNKSPFSFFFAGSGHFENIDNVTTYICAAVILSTLALGAIIYIFGDQIMAEYRDPAVLLTPKINQVTTQDIREATNKALDEHSSNHKPPIFKSK